MKLTVFPSHVVLGLAALIHTTLAQSPRLSPSLANPFSVPLHIPPVKQALTSYTDDTGTTIDFYEVKVTPFTKKVFPDIAGPGARLVGYDGQEPGPTFHIRKGRETLVRVVNENSVANGGNGRSSVVHLHGSYSKYLLRSVVSALWIKVLLIIR